MTPAEWIALGTFVVITLSAVIGSAWAISRHLGGRFTGLGRKIDGITRELDIKIESAKGALQIQLDGLKDQAHENREELLQRMTRVETLIGNGHHRRQRQVGVNG